MKKVYTIGRDPSCDIVLSDKSDVVSRVHASLKVKGPGKFVIVDQGRNGTYVNGIKMSPNEEVPVTRKDQISFAHVADLDWEQIPKEKSKGVIWGSALAAAVLVGVGLFFLLRPDVTTATSPASADSNIIATSLSDTTKKQDTEALPKKNAVKDKEAKQQAKPAPKKETAPKKAPPVKEQPKAQPKPAPKPAQKDNPKIDKTQESKKPSDKDKKNTSKTVIF